MPALFLLLCEMEKVTKRKAQDILSLEGKVRGMALKSHGDFILKKEGPEGLKKLKERMKELGFSLKHNDIEPMDFYPIGAEALELLLMREIFGYEDEKFKEVGAFGAKSSLIMRLFMKYLFSLKAIIKHAPKIWSRYYSEGKLEVGAMSEEEKKIVFIVKGFKVHRYHCFHVAGFLQSTLKMALGGAPVKIKETKCMCKGDEHHEFEASWSGNY